MRSLIILSAALVAGCVSTTNGRFISDAELDSVTVGYTTVTEVRAKFGRPLSDVRTSNGLEVLGYGWSHASASAFGAAHGQTRSIIFEFAPDGTLMQRLVAEGGI